MPTELTPADVDAIEREHDPFQVGDESVTEAQIRHANSVYHLPRLIADWRRLHAEVDCWKGRETAYRTGYLELRLLVQAWLEADDAAPDPATLEKERKIIEAREALRKYLEGT